MVEAAVVGPRNSVEQRGKERNIHKSTPIGVLSTDNHNNRDEEITKTK
jgi:hypothetical protein